MRHFTWQGRLVVEYCPELNVQDVWLQEPKRNAVKHYALQDPTHLKIYKSKRKHHVHILRIRNRAQNPLHQIQIDRIPQIGRTQKLGSKRE